MYKLVAFLCLVACVASIPVDSESKVRHQSVMDRVIVPDWRKHGLDRNSIIPGLTWPNARVPYQIDATLANYTKLIREMMDYIEERTCIKFVEKTSKDKPHLQIEDRRMGCLSGVGYWDFEDEILLSLEVTYCLNKGVILHELTHALGMFHEHQRLDRDEYIEIHWENIKDGFEDQFELVDPELSTTYNGFDYKSIMMYGDETLSKDFDLKTMTPKKPGVVLKDNQVYSDSDVYRLKKMYNCP